MRENLCILTVFDLHSIHEYVQLVKIVVQGGMQPICLFEILRAREGCMEKADQEASLLLGGLVEVKDPGQMLTSPH
jgi:hypothetical protein